MSCVTHYSFSFVRSFVNPGPSYNSVYAPDTPLERSLKGDHTRPTAWARRRADRRARRVIPTLPVGQQVLCSAAKDEEVEAVRPVFCPVRLVLVAQLDNRA